MPGIDYWAILDEVRALILEEPTLEGTKVFMNMPELLGVLDAPYVNVRIDREVPTEGPSQPIAAGTRRRVDLSLVLQCAAPGMEDVEQTRKTLYTLVNNLLTFLMARRTLNDTVSFQYGYEIQFLDLAVDQGWLATADVTIHAELTASTT